MSSLTTSRELPTELPANAGRAAAGIAIVLVAQLMIVLDATVVNVALPRIDADLGFGPASLSWVLNAYTLAFGGLLLLGGRLGDVFGRRRAFEAGLAVFTVASALCGAAPSSGAGEAWLIAFRIVQGAFGAILFPSALAIAAATFDVAERGKALALFFGITGALTSVGPLAGGFLIEWTWRAIFWINIPVALIALALTLRARPAEDRRAVPIDARGAMLVSAGMGLAVLGLQQASVWGWGSVATIACLVAGAAVLGRGFQQVFHGAALRLVAGGQRAAAGGVGVVAPDHLAGALAADQHAGVGVADGVGDRGVQLVGVDALGQARAAGGQPGGRQSQDQARGGRPHQAAFLISLPSSRRTTVGA